MYVKSKPSLLACVTKTRTGRHVVEIPSLHICEFVMTIDDAKNILADNNVAVNEARFVEDYIDGVAGIRGNHKTRSM